MKLGFYSTASAVEYLSSSWFGLKLNGYEACLRSNPKIEELLHILKIKHLSSLQDVTPEQKLLGVCLFSALTIHQLNTSSSDAERYSQPPHKE